MHVRARGLVPLGLLLAGLAGGCRQAPLGCAGGTSATRADRGATQQQAKALEPPAGPPLSAEELASTAGRLFYLSEIPSEAEGAGHAHGEAHGGLAQVGRWRPDGTAAPVTTGPKAHFPAGPAPGGRLAVIEVEEQGEGALHHERFVLLGDDGKLEPLPVSGLRARHPNFSADGKWLYYESGVEGSSEIFRLSLPKGAPSRLTNNPEGNFDPDLAPDERSLVFASSRDGSLEIYSMKADGSEQRRLTEALGDDFLPRWSPDGKRIAFLSAREGTDRVYLAGPDGSGQRRACAQPTPTGAAQEGTEAGEKDHVWSPDGRRLAFAAREWGGRFRIWIADAETGACHPLTAGQANEDMPAFSPDGKHLAFVSERDGAPQIYLVRASGSPPVRLTPDAGPNWLPTWLP